LRQAVATPGNPVSFRKGGFQFDTPLSRPAVSHDNKTESSRLFLPVTHAACGDGVMSVHGPAQPGPLSAPEVAGQDPVPGAYAGARVAQRGTISASTAATLSFDPVAPGQEDRRDGFS
jgi:hypothetical protein